MDDFSDEESREPEDELDFGPEIDSEGRPTVLVNKRPFREVVSDALDSLIATNDPPYLFRSANVPIRLIVNGYEKPYAERLRPDSVRYYLKLSANFKKVLKDDIEDVPPPGNVIGDILVNPHLPFPVLDRILSAPVYASDLTLQTAPGYHPKARCYIYETGGFVVPDVPANPTPDELAAAKALLLELLADFPFVHEAELAHAVSLILLPFIREAIAGPTPLHLIEAPMAGTGKTELARATVGVALGPSDLAILSEGTQEEEWRKRLTAVLITAPPAVIIDNLGRKLDSQALAATLTARQQHDRIITTSNMARWQVRAVFVATGNNPLVSTEIARRCIRIRLDAKMDVLQNQRSFRHYPLERWIEQNRGELIAAALTVIQAWVAAGAPRGTEMLDSFEDWAGVMGGILDVAGIPGFLANKGVLMSTSDPEQSAHYHFVQKWWAVHGTNSVTSAQLWPLADILSLDPGPEANQRTQLGKTIANLRDRQMGNVFIRRMGLAMGGGVKWKLEEVPNHVTDVTDVTGAGMEFPYEIHPDALTRGEIAMIFPTGEGTGIVVAGTDYVLRMKMQGAEKIETLILTPPEGKTVEQIIADVDRALPDGHGFLWR